MAELSELVAVLDSLAEDDAAAALADGESVVVLLAQLERVAALATRAVAAFEAGGEWAASGARSAATWISTERRLPRRTVHRRVHAGRALRHMPETEAAWLAGEIAEAHVALLRTARATSAEAFQRDEKMLVGQAASLQHRDFDHAIAYWCQLADPDGIEDLARLDHDRRRAHLSNGLRGTGFLDARFDPLSYAAFKTVLEAIEQELFEADWAEARRRLGDAACARDLRRTPAQRRHDALVEMARRAAAMPPYARLPDPLFTVLVDYDTFAERVCRIEGGPVVTPGLLVPWLTEAQVERVVFGAGNRVMNVGVRRRVFTGATRRAVEVRDQECFHPYCDVAAPGCEVDHIQPWAAGGPTVVDNGRCACAFHNRQRHQRPAPPGPADDDPP